MPDKRTPHIFQNRQLVHASYTHLTSNLFQLWHQCTVAISTSLNYHRITLVGSGIKYQ